MYNNVHFVTCTIHDEQIIEINAKKEEDCGINVKTATGHKSETLQQEILFIVVTGRMCG
jgi:hypothetical protein